MSYIVIVPKPVQKQLDALPNIVSSIVLIDQVGGLDLRRVLGYLGTLTSEQYAPIFEGLMQLFRQS